MKIRLLTGLQTGIAYSLTFIGGGMLLRAGDTSYREIVIRDGFIVGIACLTVTMLLPKTLKAYLIGSLFAVVLLAAIAGTESYPSSLLSKLLFYH